MKKILIITIFAALMLAVTATSALAYQTAHYANWNYPHNGCSTGVSPNGCYGGVCGPWMGTGGYNYAGAGQMQGYSRWNRMKYYYHYPGRGYFDDYSPWNEYPTAYGHIYSQRIRNYQNY